MGILDRLFKNRRKHPSSLDEVNVMLRTTHSFSEEQKNVIINLVKKGVVDKLEMSDIAINIMICLGVHLPIAINIADNGTDVDVHI